jgi:NAD(P)-dependent dehydrogenase (short-subunit alcohol dehydrogenase family)
MSRRLEGKRIIVTGAARGIGRAYALAMAGEGARVVVNDIGGDVLGAGEPEVSSAAAVVSEIEASGCEALADSHDIADPQGATALVACAREAFGGLDALVNNAAIDFRGSIEEHEPADWDRLMGVNARGTFNCVRSAIPLFKAHGKGVILNTTSGAFWEGTEGVAAYAASKAAVFALTLTQHTELAPLGIRSNCIAPNATRTRMVDSWLDHLSKTTDRAEAEVALEYGIQPPENLAPLAIALCSDALAGISGRVFEVWSDRISLIEPPMRGSGIEREGDAWRVDSLIARLPELVGA